VKIMGEFVTKTPTIGFEVKIMGELWQKHQPLDLKWRSWVSCDKNTNHWIWSEDRGWVVTKTWDSMVLWMIRYNTLIGTIWWWVGVDQPIIKYSNINSKAPHCCNLVWTSRGWSQATNFFKNWAKIQHHITVDQLPKSPKSVETNNTESKLGDKVILCFWGE
jgi:hypothetical protein